MALSTATNDDLPAARKELGMPSGHANANAFRACKTCVGTEFCRYGVGDSTGLGIKIENRFQGLGRPFGDVDTHEDVRLYVERFLQYYRGNAKYLERTYGFVERVVIEKIRAVVMDASEGLAEALDAAMQAAVDAYVDPWQEAERPATSHQFSGVVA